MTFNRFHPNSHCYCCGVDNAASLGLQIEEAAGGQVVGVARLDDRHQGTPGLAHGGAIAVLMDEMLGALVAGLPEPAVTGRLTVEFRAPIVLPREVRMRAWSERVDGRKRYVRGEVRAGDDVVAEAHGLWLIVDEEYFRARGVPRPLPVAPAASGS